MILRNHIHTGIVCLAAAMALTGCGKDGDTVAAAQTRIFTALEGQGIYERGKLPEDNPPTPDRIKGWFDVVGGAYRHIVNEDRANRGPAPEYALERGDSITFVFDARVFSGGSFDNYPTFYTNDPQRISALFGSNPDFKGWPTKPLRIKLGEDPGILKSLQEALIGCRANDDKPENDDQPGGISSDEVRVYLTHDLAFGNRTVYDVPPGSTVVFLVTEIQIIELRN
jgi:hypothetical protein